MTPSLYDLLDLEPTATEAEIRAAWRTAIADLDPSDRRFRAYNRAAEVLLDPERRAEHDAELAADAAADDADDVDGVGEVPPAVAAPAAARAPAKKAPAKRPAEKKPAEKKPAEKKPAEKKPAEKRPAEKRPAEKKPISSVRRTGSAPARREVPTWVLAVLAVLTVGVLGAAVFVVTDGDEASASSSSTQAAEDAAVAAAVPVLSYDWRSLDDGEATARTYLTDEYATEYGDLIDRLAPDAESQQIVVDAEVMASGISRTGDDRVDVLVFVNQVTQKKGSDPFTLKMWATMQMVREGSDWLVDQLVVDTVAPDTPPEPETSSDGSDPAPGDTPSSGAGRDR